MPTQKDWLIAAAKLAMKPMAGWNVLDRKTYSPPVLGMIVANIPYRRLNGRARAAAIGMATSRLLCGKIAGNDQYVNMMYTTPTLATLSRSIRHGDPTRTRPDDSRLKMWPVAPAPAVGLATDSLILVLLIRAQPPFGAGRYARSSAWTM